MAESGQLLQGVVRGFDDEPYRHPTTPI
jgi:hypothetical protein